jgi:hypothetical protein
MFRPRAAWIEEDNFHVTKVSNVHRGVGERL